MRALVALFVALALPSAASAGCEGEFASLAKYAGEYPDKFLQEPVIRSRMVKLAGPDLARLDADLEVPGRVALIDCELVVRGNAAHQGGEHDAILSFNLFNGRMTIGLQERDQVTVLTSSTEEATVAATVYDHLPTHVRDWALVSAHDFRSRGQPPPNVTVVSRPAR